MCGYERHEAGGAEQSHAQRHKRTGTHARYRPETHTGQTDIAVDIIWIIDCSRGRFHNQMRIEQIRKT